MKLILILIYYILVIVKSASENLNNTDTDITSDVLPRTDLIGFFLRIFEFFLSQYAINVPKNYESCSVQSLVLDGLHEFCVNVQPFGSCPYCCPLDKPSNHVNLYFTNKEKRGVFKRLKTVRRQGLLKSAGVNKDLLTIIFVHGFTEHGGSHTGRLISDAYLNREEDYNIILVDWKDLSAFPWYHQAVNNTRIVGKLLAHNLRFYNKTGEIELSKVHIIGYSLGAQVAGFAGKCFKGRYKIGRITALDPAFPLYPLEDGTERLSRSDADFVDVIHTNGGWFGFPISLGHADFYPNGGGFYQPGCHVSDLVDRGAIQLVASCSHYLSIILYVESIRNPTAFPTRKCDITSTNSLRSCGPLTDVYMGFSANKSYLGNFYLTVDSRPLFAKSIY